MVWRALKTCFEVQYDQYFSSFSYVGNLFYDPLGNMLVILYKTKFTGVQNIYPLLIYDLSSEK